MPYVKQEIRPDLDHVVSTMVNMGVKVDGDLNYILFAFCKRHIKPSYNNYKNYCGELNECAAEIRRRFLVLHEKKKIEENGDVE